MNAAATTIVVGIYLHGDGLQPDTITQVLRVAPTRAQVAGGVRYGSSTAKAKSGMWALLAQTASGCVSEHIDELLDEVGNFSKPLSELPGVERACLDVFISSDGSSGSWEPLELVVSVDQITILRRLGLFLHLTVA